MPKPSPSLFGADDSAVVVGFVCFYMEFDDLQTKILRFGIVNDFSEWQFGRVNCFGAVVNLALLPSPRFRLSFSHLVSLQVGRESSSIRRE
jgi:hypothetical protein